MSLYEPTIPTRYTLPLLHFLNEEQPAWLDQALADSGIDEAVLNNQDAMLDIAQFDRLWQHISQHANRSDLAFQLGQRIRLEMHGPLTQAIVRCATVDEMLRLSSRYFRLITPSFSLQYWRHPDHGELIWRPAAGMSGAAMRAFEEIHVVSLYIQLRQMVGPRLTGYDSYFSMPAPPHVALYQGLRPLRAHFGSGSPLPEVRTVLGRELLAQPLQTAIGGTPLENRELERLQGRFAKARAWTDWVRLMLREAEHCQPTLAQLADLLNMGSHTLARKLEREGCDYRVLSTTIRHQRACDMLAETGYSIAHIAWRLGYTDTGNFSNAFRKLGGMTPSAYRRAHRTPGGSAANG